VVFFVNGICERRYSMALITSIGRQYNKPNIRKQVEVRAEFFEIEGKYVQIQTYSSNKSQTKSRSQTIRLTKKAALDLAALINNVFNK
jgi:hypothetical protein